MVKIWLTINRILMVILIACAPAMLILCISKSAKAEVTAGRITASNASKYLSDAPDRIGGIGDWYLANDIIWAIIDDTSQSSNISMGGGTLVDLGLISHRGEQLIHLMPFLNMTRDLIVPFDKLEIENGEGWASIVVSTTNGLRPERPGLGIMSEEEAKNIFVETEYKLVESENFLRIKTTVTNKGKGKAKIFSVADLVSWGDDAMKPFAASDLRIGKSRGNARGFNHPLLEYENPFSILDTIGGYTYVAGGGVSGLPSISYGLCSPTEYEAGRHIWGINDRIVSAIGKFPGKFNRPLDIWKLFFWKIPPGENLVYERLLVVGDRNDVASVTDTIFQLLGKTNTETGVKGRIEPAGADTSIVILTEKDNLPITQIRPTREGADAGMFKAILPPGQYVAEIRSVERDPDLTTAELEPLKKGFTVTDRNFTDVGAIALPDVSRLLVEVFEGENRSPARVIIQGSSGTPDPKLGTDLLGFTLNGHPTPENYLANWALLTGNENRPVTIELRPGKYHLYATRGFEYSIAETEIDLSKPGSEQNVRLEIEKVIDTPNMICGDFHVHACPSADSAVNLEQRVKTFVAEGVDLLIATDHDALTQYAPVISRLNLTHRLTSIVGVESTSTNRLQTTPFTIGHYNAWPLKYEPTLPRRGMVQDEGFRPRDLYERIREIADGDPIIQVNHGRYGDVGDEASYFNALGLTFDEPLGYDPNLPLTEYPNNLLLVENSNGVRDIDFDAMELLNGPYYNGYALLKADWFSLLNQGYTKTAVANSDTHVVSNLAGYPRNYVLFDDPEDNQQDGKNITKQIRKHRTFGTAGPFIEFNINNRAKIGDLITVEDGKAQLNIKVLAAPWIPLDEICIFANGEKIETFKAGRQSETARFEKSLSMTLKKDTWFVIEAFASGPKELGIITPPGGLYNIVAPEFAPLAFTNPILVDVDGNGVFDPPGIPSPTTEKQSRQ